MTIRRAKKEDINRLLDLLLQVLKTHVALRPDVFNDNTTKYRREELLSMVEDDNNPIYVICEKEEVLGYAFCQIRVPGHTHLLKRTKTFYIDDFCIDESMRRKHLGGMLFNLLKAEAIRLGCQEMTLNCWIDNEPANKFYERMGFKARSQIMEYIIDDED